MKEESGLNTIRKVCIAAAIVFVLISFLPTQNAYSGPISAKRIIPTEPVMPGDPIEVRIKLEGEKEDAKRLEFIETIHNDLEIVKCDDAKIDPSKLTFTRDLTTTSWPTELKYTLKIREGASKKNYQISGKLKVFDTTDPNDKGREIPIEESSISVESGVMISWIVAVVLAITILAVFIFILIISYIADHSLSKGEMRRTIAGTLITGFFLLTVLCIYYKILQNEVILAYINLVGIVVGFYFGSRTAEHDGSEDEDKDKIVIENVHLVNNKKIRITVRNKGDNVIRIDKIYVDNESLNGKDEDIIPSKKSKDIERDLAKELPAGAKPAVKVVTSNGIAAMWPSQG